MIENTASPMATTHSNRTDEGSFISIRGRRLDLRELVDSRLCNPDYLRACRGSMAKAPPFAHLVVEGWFNEKLLQLIVEEFDILGDSRLDFVRTRHEDTRRSPVGLRLQPASQLYFDIVNSGWFVEAMSAICEVDDLIADARLIGGGLHETVAGGSFDVHRDFDLHVRNGLRNELVLLTYLNKDWNPEWGGALELWDVGRGCCVRQVRPEMGVSILLRHSDHSYHGHPNPMTPPEGHRRRSVATYYYSNPAALWLRSQRNGTEYLAPRGIDRLKRFAQLLTPPLLWDFLRQQRRL